MASEDIGGGWQLDAQHKYNFHAGILQKGDGHTVYLKYKPHVSLLDKIRWCYQRVARKSPSSSSSLHR